MIRPWCGDIGEEPREYEVVPLTEPTTAPVETPAPAPAPAEPVPA